MIKFRHLKKISICVFLLISFTGFTQVQIGELISSYPDDEKYGHSVVLSETGNRMIVGAPGKSNYGFAYVYEWNGTSWNQLGQDLYGPDNITDFGSTVAISPDGNRVGVSSIFRTIQDESFVSVVTVYEWNGNSWVQLGAKVNDGSTGDFFGHSISFSSDGSRIAISEPRSNLNGFETGRVLVFEWNGISWEKMGDHILGDASNQYFGWSLTLSANGNRLGVYTPRAGNNNPVNPLVRIFEWNGISWDQVGQDFIGETSPQTFPLGIEFGQSSQIGLTEDGNRVVIGDHRYNYLNPNSGRVRVFDWDGTEWIQAGQNLFAGAYTGFAVSISNDGNRLAIGASESSTNLPLEGNIRIYEWKNEIWHFIGNDLPGGAEGLRQGKEISLSKDGTKLAVGLHHPNTTVKVYDLNGAYGNIFNDVSADCIRNNGEIGVVNIPLLIEPGDIITQTNQYGNWYLPDLPAGNYSLKVDTAYFWKTNCLLPSDFSITSEDTLSFAPDFGLYPSEICENPIVSIVMPFVRRCFDDQRIYISACNDYTATGAIENPEIIVNLDELIVLQNVSLPYTDLGENAYAFDLPVNSLPPGQCVDFVLNVGVSCDAMLDQTLCLKAEFNAVDDCVYLDESDPENSDCSLPWDNSNLEVVSYCQNDSVYFEVINSGDLVDGDMDCFSDVYLYLDSELIWIDSLMIAGGTSQIFGFPGNGGTYHFFADQHPLHPGNSSPNDFVENCGSGTWTPDLVNTLPQDDIDLVRDVYCGLVTGAFDPNDKTGFPLGIKEEHLISPNQPLEYLIRFQNTGNDTAFTVIIRDTLSAHLDILSVRSGVASHTYDFRMYGPRILEWRFDNILLPDSTTNLLESNGFIKFEVEQVRNLPEGTIIENTASIYFDFNDPIITNTYFHQIDYGINEIFTSVFNLKPQGENTLFALVPNPSTDRITIIGDSPLISSKVRVEFSDLSGKMIKNMELNNQGELDISNLINGLYLVKIIFDDGYTEVHKLLKM